MDKRRVLELLRCALLNCDNIERLGPVAVQAVKSQIQEAVRLFKLTEVRSEVQWFAGEMEKALQQNDWKGGWKGCDLWDLFVRLRQESNELGRAILAFQRAQERSSKDSQLVSTLIKEAADVANFCMFVADVARSE